MAKYQFFKRTDNNHNEVRYLCTDAINFLSEKESLLQQNFEVVGDMIHAKDENEALAHFNSGMIYPLEEYNKSSVMGGLFYFVKSLALAAVGYFRKKKIDNA